MEKAKRQRLAAGGATRLPVWLDCDPGHDDAMAIVLAGHSPALQLLGVSTVVGNQTLDKVTDNALRMLKASGLEHIDVVKGAHRPLMRDPPLCPEIHGESGLSPHRGDKGTQQQPQVAHHTAEASAPEADLPMSTRPPVSGKAPVVMFEAIQQAYHDSGHRCRIVATASLTNVALLVALYPEVVDMAEVVLMGGAMGVGNTGPVMEFNIQTDPEAAAMVFEAGWPVTMIPIEVTHTALVTPEVLARIKQPDTAYCRIICRLLLFFQETYRDVFSFEHPPLHDPCAVAYCIAPHIFEVKTMRVDIERHSELSPGQTVCDIWGQSSKPKNAAVAMKMEVPAFWDLLLDSIYTADKASCMNTANR